MILGGEHPNILKPRHLYKTSIEQPNLDRKSSFASLVKLL